MCGLDQDPSKWLQEDEDVQESLRAFIKDWGPSPFRTNQGRAMRRNSIDDDDSSANACLASSPLVPDCFLSSADFSTCPRNVYPTAFANFKETMSSHNFASKKDTFHVTEEKLGQCTWRWQVQGNRKVVCCPAWMPVSLMKR